MKWYFLIVGTCGVPFTSGWSLPLGLVAFAVAWVGQSVSDRTSREMRQARTPLGVIAWLFLGLIAFTVLLALFGVSLIATLEGLGVQP